MFRRRGAMVNVLCIPVITMDRTVVTTSGYFGALTPLFAVHGPLYTRLGHHTNKRQVNIHGMPWRGVYVVAVTFGTFTVCYGRVLAPAAWLYLQQLSPVPGPRNGHWALGNA